MFWEKTAVPGLRVFFHVACMLVEGDELQADYEQSADKAKWYDRMVNKYPV